MMLRKPTVLLFVSFMPWVNECSEEEANALLPVIKAVLTALRSSKGYNIE